MKIRSPRRSSRSRSVSAGCGGRPLHWMTHTTPEPTCEWRRAGKCCRWPKGMKPSPMFAPVSTCG
eukprot:2089847-Alexandrium_andersonii.AAC.1